ncbi:MAG: SpoIIE family protein phosphatase [Solirubrobacteraceae bacterium]
MDLPDTQAILEVAHSAVISMDESGRIVYWNPRAEQIFGIPRERAIGRVLADTIIPERYREAHWHGLRQFKRTGSGRLLDEQVQLSALRADGSEFPIEMSMSALQTPEGWLFYAFIIDISERRDAEEERQNLLDELQRALQGSEQRLATIVDALAEAVTIRGHDNHLIYANRAALERLDMSSVEELRCADPRALMGPYETVTEDGREIRMDDLPSVRLLRGEQPEPLLMRTVHRDSGQESWVLLKATAVRDPSGEIETAVTIIEDVTAAKRAALRLEFLAQASELLASSLDYQETLRTVAGLAVPQIADWCAVDLFDQDGDRVPVAVAHVDPAKLELAQRLRQYGPDQLDPEQGLGLVRRTGEPLLYPEISQEMLERGATDPEQLRLLREVGLRSALIVPMKAQGRTIGALTLVNAESERTFDEDDVKFVEQIAERASIATENARLYSERSRVAQTLQSSLLPQALPDVPGWELSSMYRPASDESDVGGDFYDVWRIERDWIMMIGDVTGKGVEAAAVTSLVRHCAWSASEVDPQPAQILARIDASLKRRGSLSLCTALCLRISGARCEVASGGHPLLLHLGKQGVAEIGQPGTLLGGCAKTHWPLQRFTMRPGESLIAITDGVTDALGTDRERFGVARLREALTDKHASADTLKDRLAEAVDQFQVGSQADDMAIVTMRFTGTPEDEAPPTPGSHQESSRVTMAG